MTYRNNAILTPQRTYLTWFQSDFTLKIFEVSFRLFAMSVLLGDLLVTIPKNGRLILRCAKKWNIKICCTSDLYPYDGFYVGNDPKMSEHVRLVCFFYNFLQMLLSRDLQQIWAEERSETMSLKEFIELTILIMCRNVQVWRHKNCTWSDTWFWVLSLGTVQIQCKELPP